MDTKGFEGMGVWAAAFTVRDEFHTETRRNYLAVRAALSLLAVSGCVQ